VKKQGTIKTYDHQTRSGTILDDAQTEYAFGPDSFVDTGMREFRLGQRVKFRVEGESPKIKVRDLTLVTF
jgi:2-phospho-L-lactate guanylyltransferase